MKKIILVALVILVLVSGCSSLGKKREIEQRLNDKYDIQVKVKKTWGSKTGYTSFIAYPKDNPQHEFQGRHNPFNDELSDNYADTFVASKIAEYLTEEFQEIIPGAVFMVEPAGLRYYDIDTIELDVDMQSWLDQNYENAKKGNNTSVGMVGYVLIPAEVAPNVNFEEYRSKVIDVFSGELSKVVRFYMKGSYIFVAENKQQMVDTYTYGKIDTLELIKIQKSLKDDNKIDQSVVTELNSLTTFAYRDTDFESSEHDIVFKYNDEGVDYE